MKIYKNIRGVSLPLVAGLVALLMVSSAAVNELIIRAMRSSQRIEASSRAYMAAEAGLEDALYELSPHFAGYQTPALNDAVNVRSAYFDNSGNVCNEGEDGDWCNEWQIESRSGSETWDGKMYKGQKLTINLFVDQNNFLADLNAVNNGPFSVDDIDALNVAGSFSIKFRIPANVIQSGKLKIDNDEDFGITAKDYGLNEDPAGVFSDPLDAYYCPENPEDQDCDGLVDEDSEKDSVILWKLTDGADKSLIPIKGCLLDPFNPGSEICEDNFSQSIPFAPSDWITLDQNTEGSNEIGQTESIGEFFTRSINENSNAKLHFEFLIIAPMEHAQVPIDYKKYEIPYIEYEVSSPGVDQLPFPYFTIKSDGYYRHFKQSITSIVTPKTSVPLFDFTIIQQE